MVARPKRALRVRVRVRVRRRPFCVGETTGREGGWKSDLKTSHSAIILKPLYIILVTQILVNLVLRKSSYFVRQKNVPV